jgi:transcriptional regulator of acetoin/glycerol metabolism
MRRRHKAGRERMREVQMASLSGAPAGRGRHSDHVISTVESGQQAGTSAVAASWCRSALHHGLDPAEARAAARLGAGELAGLRAANSALLAAATPALDRLFGSVGQTGCCVILSDLDGVVLEARSGAGDAGLFEAIGLAPGAVWSEASEGTNGIGTCLVEQRPVSILRGEHFASRNIGVSCMDAPVFDPEGQLVAALDVSSARADHGEAMAGLIAALVQDAASQIEREFFCRHFSTARIVHAPDGGGRASALLAVDRDDLVIGATRAGSGKRRGLRGGRAGSAAPGAGAVGRERGGGGAAAGDRPGHHVPADGARRADRPFARLRCLAAEMSRG